MAAVTYSGPDMSQAASPERRPHGALKTTVLEIVLHAERPLTAQEIRGKFDASGHVPALSTVLTVLDRLRRQGVVTRATGEGGDYEFGPAAATSERAAHSMLDMLLSSADRGGALTRFAGSLDAEDLEVLRSAIDRQGRPQRRARG